MALPAAITPACAGDGVQPPRRDATRTERAHQAEGGCGFFSRSLLCLVTQISAEPFPPALRMQAIGRCPRPQATATDDGWWAACVVPARTARCRGGLRPVRFLRLDRGRLRRSFEAAVDALRCVSGTVRPGRSFHTALGVHACGLMRGTAHIVRQAQPVATTPAAVKGGRSTTCNNNNATSQPEPTHTNLACVYLHGNDYDHDGHALYACGADGISRPRKRHLMYMPGERHCAMYPGGVPHVLQTPT